MERRLVTLLALDIVGYSRLMREDEEGTFATLLARRRIIDKSIAKRAGRIFNTAGDSVLAEFSSPVEAVRCAADIQNANALQNSGPEQDRKMQLRIGINLGDVIDEGGNLFGDGVNVAARLESIAHPDGICISQSVYEQVRDLLDIPFEDIGPQEVKNIDRPVRAYSYSPSGRAKPAQTETVLRSEKNAAIAVLPFENMSGDSAQDYLADGVTEEIITTLSQIPELMVVSRQSTLTYKNQKVDARQIGREQGATHMLEGSLRAAGNRVRVSAQLVDTKSGHHLWAERYDRELDDIFELQDEIAIQIASALQGEILDGEMARLRGSGTKDLKAWEYHIKAIGLMRRVSKVPYEQALSLIRKAIDCDPTYSAALSSRALIHAMEARHGFQDDRAASIALARKFALQALDCDPDNSEAYGILGFADALDHKLDAAIDKFKTSLRMNPNHAEVAARLALALTFNGQTEEAVQVAETGLKLCPSYPPWYAGLYGFTLRANGRLTDSIPYFQEYGSRSPGFGHVDLVIVYVTLGDMDSAHAEVAKVLKHRPKFTISAWAKTQLYSDPKRGKPDIEALRKAGLPE